MKVLVVSYEGSYLMKGKRLISPKFTCSAEAAARMRAEDATRNIMLIVFAVGEVSTKVMMKQGHGHP